MTAPETFTTASRQPLTKGRRPDMAAICAKRTAGVDVQLPLGIATVDALVGRTFAVPGAMLEGRCPVQIYRR
jgi:hypothetical protein